MTLSIPPVRTLGEVAQLLGVPSWKVARLFERWFLPEPQRVGQFRVIAEADLPQVEAALRRAGYLPAAQADASQPITEQPGVVSG